MDNVFYAHDEQAVRDSSDLAEDGLLDSLSIVVILETFADAGVDEEALEQAQATDFRNLEVMKAAYERL
ncbi:Uncharacterised protein [Dermatophilus congolensis]|uniref:Carrier domain-containing protein n=2 Tax=Dermatophilus congolensis TaxID=1863 RepID=A0A239VSN7_9MICO|nr:Uncharacterised protein [Dermatophilus congolensis]STD11257.1 Uncharacterised protein [Dermatophilus congolensis]